MSVLVEHQNQGFFQGAPPVGEIFNAINSAALKFQTTFIPEIKPEPVLTREERLWEKLDEVHRQTELLSDPEAPDVGRLFMEGVRHANCKIVIDQDLDAPDTQNRLGKKMFAEYVAYTLGAGANTFANTIALPPSKVDDSINSLASTYRHEEIHAQSTANAEILNHTVYNQSTKIIMHPLPYLTALVLCEDVAYAGQGFLNYLDAKKDPSIREATKRDLVSVEEFEQKRAAAWSLENALVNCALNALSKNKTNEETFHDHYHASGLDNFARGMKWRIKDGETGQVFFRPEASEYHEIGKIGFCPNPLGEKFIDPGFLKLKLNAKNQARLDELCAQYNIPRLEDCPTLKEAREIERLRNEPVEPAMLQMAASNSGQHLQMA